MMCYLWWEDVIYYDLSVFIPFCWIFTKVLRFVCSGFSSVHLAERKLIILQPLRGLTFLANRRAFGNVSKH